MAIRLISKLAFKLGLLGRPELLTLPVDSQSVAARVRPLMIDWTRVSDSDAARLPADFQRPRFKIGLRQSKIAPDAGYGVFVESISPPLPFDSPTSSVDPVIPTGTVIGLYPGRVIPPPPRWAMPLDGSLPAGGKLLLYEHSQLNAYVLNMEDGGLVEADCHEDIAHLTPASALSASVPPSPSSASNSASASVSASASASVSASASAASQSSNPSLSPFPASNVQLPAGWHHNPFARGHRINHASGTVPNVASISFRWADTLQPWRAESLQQQQAVKSKATVTFTSGDSSPSPSPSPSSSSTTPISISSLPRFALPNCFDYLPDTAWCLDASTHTVLMFPQPPGSEDESVYERQLPGVAMVLLREVRAGDELLMDYDLRGPPYAAWAADWFKPAVARL